MIFHYFTYENDAECLDVSISRVRAVVPDARTYVWDDAHKPMSDFWMSKFSAKQTFFHRNKNLRGPEVIPGMLSCYKASFDENPGASHIVRLDPDTLLVRLDSLRAAVSSGVFAASWSFPGAPFTGMCQVISRELVDEGLEFLAPGRTIPGTTPAMGEGRQLAALASYIAAGREIRRWEFNRFSGFGAAYLYSQAKVPVSEYLRRFEAITFGAGMGCPSKRLEAAMMMRRAALALA